VKEKEKAKRKPYRWLRRLARIVAGVLLFIILALLFIRSPWGQDIIVNQLVDYVSEKTNTEFKIDKFFITFNGNIQIEGLYLEDKKGDTLVYSKSLEADIPLWETITGSAYGVENVEWQTVKANLIRKDSLEGFNFQFLIDAFATPDDSPNQPETNTPVSITLGAFDLSEFDVVFNDAVSGIQSHYQFKTLVVNMQSTAIDSMVFKASKIYLENSSIEVNQQPVDSEPSTESRLPQFYIENIHLVKNKTIYQSPELSTDLNIHNFQADAAGIDLNTPNFQFDRIQLQESVLALTLNTIENEAEAPDAQSSGFEWPSVGLNIAEIDLQNNTIGYAINGQKPKKNSFNSEHLKLAELNLKAIDVLLEDGLAKANIKEFNFVESSGFALNRFKGEIGFSNTELSLNDLNLDLNSNLLKGSSQLKYNSIQALINAPENSSLDVDVQNLDVSLEEIFRLAPDLKNNAYVNTLRQKRFSGRLSAKGSLSHLDVLELDLKWGDSTTLKAAGIVENAVQLEKLYVDIPKFNIETQRLDILKFVNEEDLRITLPESMALTGLLKGEVEDFFISTQLESSQGIVYLETEFVNKDRISFNTNLTAEDYQLNQLLDDEELGKLNLKLETSGSGKTLYDLNAKLNAQILEFVYSDYRFENLNLAGTMTDGAGDFTTNYKDDNLNFDLKAKVNLDSTHIAANLNLDVVGADLNALGITTRDLKTAFDLEFDLQATDTTYTADANFNDGVVVYKNDSYLIGAIGASAYVSADSTSIDVQNRIVDLELRSNASPERFTKALSRHVKSYFYRETIISDTLQIPVNLELKAKIAQSPFLKEVLLVNLKELDTVTIGVDFEEQKRTLKAQITAPHINYFKNEIDSLSFGMETAMDNFSFTFQFKNIISGPINIPETIISGLQQNNGLDLSFQAIEDNKKIMYLRSKITGNRDRLRYHINPDSLMLNKKIWQVNQNNEALLMGDTLKFNDFEIQRNGQSIQFKNTFETIAATHVGLSFDNFNLKEILNYLNPDSDLAKGKLNGDFIVVNPFEQTGFLTNIQISDLEILDTDFGILKVDATSKSDTNYDFKASLKGGLVDIDLGGEYVSTHTSPELNLDLDINSFQMKALHNLSLGEIKDGDGSFSGQFKINGDLNNPTYQGQLDFNNAQFNITKLNSVFKLENESLTLNNSGLQFDRFTLKDINDNKLSVSGGIGTKNFLNPSFDLSIKASQFKALDSNKDDNDLFYGIVILDADAEISGDLAIPKVRGKLKVDPETDFTYVIPPSIASVEKTDGVVRFVNRKNPDDILTATDEEVAKIEGFDIDAGLQISEKAMFKIIIDERTGDNFVVQGSGDLNFRMLPNGRISLYGIYEATSGHYELNLYEIVKRKFNIVSGSQVKWNGDPFNAEIDITALYNAETSASPLMASTISGRSPAERGKYRQVLPFEVYLNIDGELFQPDIGFRLDMPEDERSALGGQVYGRVQQVNQQEAELNQQVFSLLVLNRFYPTQGSDGTDGGFSTLAQQNINDAISDRLNSFSDQLLGDSGIELDFGLDSFTDYQGNSPEQRTQLNIAAQKKLFDERLTVRVGSELDVQGSNPTGETPPVIGNVSLIYELTKDGRYRLKGFRRERFENIIDGQIVVSGIALIFTKEFNRFDEFWRALFSKDPQEAEVIEEPATPDQPKVKQQNDNKTLN